MQGGAPNLCPVQRCLADGSHCDLVHGCCPADCDECTETGSGTTCKSSPASPPLPDDGKPCTDTPYNERPKVCGRLWHAPCTGCAIDKDGGRYWVWTTVCHTEEKNFNTDKTDTCVANKCKMN
jgi:hypothetical protein